MCIITFSGDMLGSILLTFPEDVALKVYAALMFEEIETLTDEAQEAFTEILNMVIGNVKASITDKKLEFDEPMVAVGQKVKYENTEGVKWLVIPMAFKEWGRFSLFLGAKIQK
jgi:chemotaxis protein CheX